MRVSEFDFSLPTELIAQQPPAVRGSSRMLVLDRQTGAYVDHSFLELPELLRAGDLLVLNDSRVLPARLFGRRAGLRTQAGSPAPDGTVEVLLTERLPEVEGNCWRALVKPAKKVQPGEVLFFGEAEGQEPLLRAEVVAAGEFGERTLRFGPVAEFHAVLERIGFLPLPPYIHRERALPNTAEDRERYQTVYSRPFGSGEGSSATGETQIPCGDDNQKSGGMAVEGAAVAGEKQIPCGDDNQRGDSNSGGHGKGVSGSGAVAGSAAAPTAGLHFTPEVLDELQRRGVEVARITLHVGLGTFQPVRVERTEEIRLHQEPYTLSEETAKALNRAWAEGRRIVAVGTTTTRTLEHLARQFEGENGPLSGQNPLRLEAHAGATGLFLSPGPAGEDAFKLVGGLVTNFHLPQSTLLMLVSAFAGRGRVLAAYAHAVEAGYRFFSYGDCMLVL